MTAATISPFLDRFNSELEQLSRDEMQDRFTGRGIVIAAGGSSMFTNAYVLVHVLRRNLNCTLPIEVWHFGVTELSPRMQSLLHELDVFTVDATDLIAAKKAPIVDGWQLKAFAVLWSRFAEILLLDADQIPALDPAMAFEWDQYRETGAVFWPDCFDLSEDNPIWNLTGLPPRQTVSFESGQALIDKRRHWTALCATYLLNAAAETVYQLIYGDKDTFLMAWLMTQSRFHLVPHRPFVDEFCLMQRDFAGTIFFQHRTNGKWSYSGEQVWPQRVLHQEASLAALAELRIKWNGRIFIPSGRSEAARRLEARIVELDNLRFEIVGGEKFTLQFLPDGEIGEGRSHDRQNWGVIDADSEPRELKLIISDSVSPAYWLVQGLDGVWTGERLRFPAAPISGYSGRAKPSSLPMCRTMVDDFLGAVNFFGSVLADDSALGEALKLLARIEPHVVQRLQILASQQTSDSPLAMRLLSLAKTVSAARIGEQRPVDKSAKILQTQYKH